MDSPIQFDQKLWEELLNSCAEPSSIYLLKPNGLAQMALVPEDYLLLRSSLTAAAAAGAV